MALNELLYLLLTFARKKYLCKNIIPNEYEYNELSIAQVVYLYSIEEMKNFINRHIGRTAIQELFSGWFWRNERHHFI